MKLLLATLIVITCSAATASAKPKHWHDDDKHWDDIRVIREYYEPRYRSLPPGLAKKYYRTGHLPPGWERKMEPVPVAVERRLVVLPPEYRRGYIDGSIIVYSPRTHVAIDVVSLFRP